MFEMWNNLLKVALFVVTLVQPCTEVDSGDSDFRSEAGVGVDVVLSKCADLEDGGVEARGLAQLVGVACADPLISGKASVEIDPGDDKNSSTLEAECERRMSEGMSSNASRPV